MPRKLPRLIHVLGTPLDVPPPEAEQLLRLGLLREESSGGPTPRGPQQATASKPRKSSGGSSKPGTP